jgi:hypothetical protein
MKTAEYAEEAEDRRNKNLSILPGGYARRK